MKLLGQCCGPCVTPSSGCVNEGCEVFSFEGARSNAYGYLPWSEPRPSVTDSTGPIVAIVTRKPESQVTVGGYDCDGNFVCAVTKNCPYRAFFSPQDVSITNGVILFSTGGHQYYGNTLTEEFFEHGAPGAQYGRPWRKIGTLAATTTAINGDFLYLAFASGADGSGYSDTYDPDLDFIAVLRSPTPLTPAEEDFAGLFTRYTPNSAAVEVLDGEFFRAKAAHIVIHCNPAQLPPGCPFTDNEWATGNITLPPDVGAVITYPNFGQKGATIDWRVVRDNSCGCSHLFGQPSGTLTFAPGEWRKRIEIPVIDHDAPKWWGCPGNYPGGLMYGYEAGAIIIENLVPDGFCAQITSDTNLIWVYCEHADGPPLNYQITVREKNALYEGPGGEVDFDVACDSPDAGFFGVWDAGANLPRLGDNATYWVNPFLQDTAPDGSYLRVGAGGTKSLDGIADWQTGDIVYASGGVWTKAASGFKNGGRGLIQTWRKVETTGFHLEEQPQGSGIIVTVNDNYLVDRWEKSFPREKSGNLSEGSGYVGPTCYFGSGVTGSTGADTYTLTFTDNGVVQQHSEGTLSEPNSESSDEAVADGLLAASDFDHPMGSVWGIQPGATAADGDGTDVFSNWGSLPLGVPNYSNPGFLDNIGGGNSATAAKARWISADGIRRTYVLREREITASWNNAQKPHVLTHVYLHYGHYRLGDYEQVGSTVIVELTNGFPVVVPAPPEWGLFTIIDFTSESEFVCHPGQAP